jgi:hypothetical protein
VVCSLALPAAHRTFDKGDCDEWSDGQGEPPYASDALVHLGNYSSMIVPIRETGKGGSPYERTVRPSMQQKSRVGIGPSGYLPAN